MKRYLSTFLVAALAATSLAPALAGPHEHGGQAAARPAAAPAAVQPQAGGGKHDRQMQPQPAAAPAQRPMRAGNGPARIESVPKQRFENRPARVENVPQQRFENRPARVENVPQQRFENRPARVENVLQQRFENRPMRVENRSARIENMPQRFENKPTHFVSQPQRFEERARTDNEQVPFADVVGPRAVRFRGAGEPAEQFVAGRVVRTDADDVFIENPIGQMIVVRGWHGHHKHWNWGSQMVTIPVVYQNGAYYAYPGAVVPAAFTTYVYPAVANYGFAPDYVYAPDYGYAPGYGYVTDYGYAPVYSTSQDYANYALASTLTGVVSNLLNGSNGGSLTHSLLTNYLTSYALSSLVGNTPAFTSVYPASYAVPAYTPVSSPLTYTYPMTCVYSDPYNGSSYYDPSCAPVATTTYYTSASAYAPAQVQGVVVGTSGSTLMVLGANGLRPVMVNDAPALSNGLAFSGQPAVGQLVTADGFYDGNTFVATALQ